MPALSWLFLIIISMDTAVTEMEIDFVSSFVYVMFKLCTYESRKTFLFLMLLLSGCHLPPCRQVASLPFGEGWGIKGIKVLNYFNVHIKFYFQFKLLIHLMLLKLNCKIYFHWQVYFIDWQTLLSKLIFDQSFRIKNASNIHA